MTPPLVCLFSKASTSTSISTGKERDSESGNDYFKYRYYASSMGRWLSPDPSGLSHADPGNPQSLNLYNYVGNRPLTIADLDGLCWKGFQWACDLGNDIKNLAIEAKNKIGYGEWTTNTTQAIVHKLDRDEAKARRNSYRKETQSAPDPDDDRPQLTAMVKGVARDTAGFPDVCSGGAFVYAGVQGKVGSGHGFAGYLGNYDSEEGWSNNGLIEGSKGNASAGAAAGSKGAEGLAFIPFAEAGGGLVGVSKNGLSLGGYAGTPETVPVGAGGGAYFTISSMGGCAHR